MDRTVSIRFNAYAGMDIGRDNGLVVDRSYEDRAPFPFTGEIKKVTFDLKPHLTSTGEEHEELELQLHQEHHQVAAAHGASAWPEAESEGEAVMRRELSVLAAAYSDDEEAGDFEALKEDLPRSAA